MYTICKHSSESCMDHLLLHCPYTSYIYGISCSILKISVPSSLARSSYFLKKPLHLNPIAVKTFFGVISLMLFCGVYGLNEITAFSQTATDHLSTFGKISKSPPPHSPQNLPHFVIMIFLLFR